MADVYGGIDRMDRGHAELVLQQDERDQGAEVGSRGQVPLPVAAGVGRGVDQAADPGGAASSTNSTNLVSPASDCRSPMRMVTRSGLARTPAYFLSTPYFPFPAERSGGTERPFLKRMLTLSAALTTC